MEANKDYIKKLIAQKNWSQNNFAGRCGVAKSTVSRWFQGKRGAGRTLMSGIIRAFPEETIDNLFIFEKKGFKK